MRQLCCGSCASECNPVADARGLVLKADGPDTLPVEGDVVKVQRIAQNLVPNALKYTSLGGVTVSWGGSRHNDPSALDAGRVRTRDRAF